MKFKLLIFFFLLYNSLSAQTLEIGKLKEIVLKKNALSDTIVLSAINNLFEYYYYQRDTTESMYYSELLIKESKERVHPFYERQGLINKAYAFLRTDIEKGKTLIDSILIEVTKVHDKLLMSQCYIYLGFDVLSKNRRDTSCYYFNEALRVLENEKSKESAEALISLAYSTANKGDAKRAIELATAGYTDAKAIGDKILITRASSKAADYHYYLSNYAKTSDFVIEAIKLAEEQKYINSDLFGNYSTLADLYWVKNQDIKKAQIYTRKAYELSKEYDNNRVKVRAASNLAYYHIVGEASNLKFAKELLSYCLKMSVDHNLVFQQAVTHFKLGMLYSKKDLFQQAYPHFIESIQLCEKVGAKNYSLRVQAFLAEEIRLSGSDLPFAIDTSNQELKSLDSEIWFYRLKRDITIKDKDYKNAYMWLEKLSEAEMQAKKEEYKINVEERLLEFKLEEQKEKLLIKEALIKSTTFKNRLLVAISILTTLFLGIFYFLYRTKNRLNREITEKNKEMSNNLKQVAFLNKDLESKNNLLAKKNTLQEKEIVDFIAFQNNRDHKLDNIKTEITKVITSNTPNIAVFQVLNNKVNQLISNKNEWIYFKQKVESLYPNFFKALLLKHPDLNEREQLHCAYILLGMSVKKVAESIFTSIKAVESARYRIKKKIDLNKTDNLSEYIKGYKDKNTINSYILY